MLALTLSIALALLDNADILACIQFPMTLIMSIRNINYTNITMEV